MAVRYTNDIITAGVAAGGLTLPWWIEVVSDAAQVFLPILGAVWLVVQIVYKIREGRTYGNNSTAGEEKDS